MAAARKPEVQEEEGLSAGERWTRWPPVREGRSPLGEPAAGSNAEVVAVGRVALEEGDSAPRSLAREPLPSEADG